MGQKAKSPARSGRFVREGPVGVGAVALALLIGFIALPLASLVIWTVSEESWEAMTHPAALDALRLSAFTTATTMGIILLVGTPAAYVLARCEFPGKRLVDTLVDIPAVLPPSAAGIALLLAFGRAGLLGEHLSALGINVSFSTAAVILAELFVASHFYVRQASVGFAQVDRSVEESAMVDGARRITVFMRVTVPLAFPALLAGAVTAWARALGEFGGTIIFAGNFRGITQTIPLAIFSELERDFDAAVALSVLVLAFAFAVILTTRFLTRRATEFER
ncbi:ABC transporter permease [Rubrobacter xylanophilus]|uniref:ABC transporter permease n=1 Tax=Rubrobacter xylanophilus TaxID=49319 RepID=UPI001179CB47|nr:ABC transporter permease [Rubrobacter xylanophilus]